MLPTQRRRLLAVAALVWLLLDLLRAWTPLLITVFGRAAETPPELIGGFALAVTAAPLLMLAVGGRRSCASSWLLPALVLGALALRPTVPLLAGVPLLTVTTAGIVLAVSALALAAARLGANVLPGLFAGVALSATTHAALGTWGAVWQFRLPGMLVTAVLVALVAWTLPELRVAEGAIPRRLGWLLLPSLLLVGVALGNPARAQVADARGAIVIAGASALAACLALRPAPRQARWASALVLVAATAAVMLPHDVLPPWTLVGFAAGMPSLAVLFSAAGGGPEERPVRTARSVAAGAIVFTMLLFAFYAGYDLGYRADWLVVLVALAVAIVAVLPAVEKHTDPTPLAPASWLTAGSLVLAAAALAWLAPCATIRPVTPAADRADKVVGVAAYNVRMGYGIDGTFRPDKVAELVRAQRAGILLLSEIDRGWLLNGGQDQLTVLARLLDMDLAFGPAADQVWGDAILADRSLVDLRHEKLPAYDSLTGAQVLAATYPGPDGPLRVIVTHIQPDAGGAEPSLRQARDIRAFVAKEQAAGVPIVLGGDFNLEPGGREFEALVREQGSAPALVDALSSARPLLTSSSDNPRQQIDHLFVSADLVASNPRTVDTQLSDHLPVLVDVAQR